jgi:hypothetical protein
MPVQLERLARDGDVVEGRESRLGGVGVRLGERCLRAVQLVADGLRS